MRRAFATLAFAAVLGAAAASFGGVGAGSAPVAAPARAVFLIPDGDGYGVAECLASGGACRQMVADSWCETKGYARAAEFRRAAPEDVTGSLAAPPPRAAGSVAVTCAR